VRPGRRLGQAGGDLEGPDQQDADSDGQDDELDEVPATLVRAGEAALAPLEPRVVTLAPDDQVDDPEDRARPDDVGEEVPEEELADDRQVERRVPDLAEGLDQRQEQAV